MANHTFNSKISSSLLILSIFVLSSFAGLNAQCTATIEKLTSFCDGETIMLTELGNADSYSWTGPNGFTATGQTISLNNNMSGLYSVEATYSATGCIATDDFQVDIGEIPLVNAVNVSGTVCSGSMFTLNETVGAAVSYLWTGPGGFTSTEQNPTFAISLGGYYIVAATDVNGCVGVDLVYVSVYTDGDGDGLCAEDGDCNDADPFLPAAPNTPCNDNNDNTINDVIQADGCTCTGVEAPPSASGCEPSSFQNAPTGLSYTLDFENGLFVISWDEYPYATGCLIMANEVSQTGDIPLVIENPVASPTSLSIPLTAIDLGATYRMKLLCGCSLEPMVVSPFTPYRLIQTSNAIP